ncbi:hypothetical protein B0H17DRAFT_291228 [Mycena rosella]|uniref:Uncharacterized protein n=1 Tax=Mycena rosella TaxID=1033263 RepID=A0AAD7G6S9_MYCRO|nr:hypothetical protein B0H17DRAFT_291228 [Mycena rosella]
MAALTFGKPDPNILRSAAGSDFNTFSFKSIGKEPELLKRISNREEGVHYQYSPSPEPEAQPAWYAAEARTRPSLLQALTSQRTASSDSPSQELDRFSMMFDSREPPASSIAAHAASKSPGLESDSMQLQYPETPVLDTVAEVVVPRKSPSPPPPPPFIPNYSALKALHARLETSHKVLAVPPPPKKAATPPPDFPLLSLIAANNTVHHTEKLHTSAKEALQASQTRVAASEQGVAYAQTIVDTLSQALLASRAALEVAQKSLLEARQAAEEAQAALTASRAAADSAEETKRLLEEPPPPRAPTPEPVDHNSEIVGEMKKDLDTLRLWVEEQEAGHLPAPVAWRDTSRDREEAEEREASSMMIAPDDTDTDVEARDTNDTVADTSAAENLGDDGEGGEVDMDIDEPRRVSEEDAAEALVALADQPTAQDEERQRRAALVTKVPEEKGKAELSTASPQAESELQGDAYAVAREATLRKMQDVQREKVRIQKEQAQAAAAMSILKERQDAAAKANTSVAQPSPPLSGADTQHQYGNAVARAVVLPPSTAAEVKVKTKKAKPVSGGVKLGPDAIVKADPSISSEPSPELERAAALGLRVRAPPMADSQSAPNSKAGPSKKMRNYSLPPIAQLSRESSPSDEISIYRTGTDKGDIPIIPPKKAPKIPIDLAIDIQLINLRFALQDEGIPWEAISRSRPTLSSVKTEDSEIALPPVEIPLSAPQLKNTPSPQLPLPTRPRIIAPIPSTPTVAPTVLTMPLKPLPSRKQLPKINKLVPTNGEANNNKPATAPSAQPQATPRSTENTAVLSRPSEAPPVTFPPKRSPSAVATSPVIFPPKRSPPAVAVASTNGNGSVYNNTPMQAQALPTTQAEAFARSLPGSGATTPVPNTNDYRSLSERVSDVQRAQSPPRYNTWSPLRRSRTPERYREPSPYGAEPAGRGRTPDRTSGWNNDSRYSPPHRWTPEPIRRAPTPPRAYTPPPRVQRPASPPSAPRYESDFSGKRSFSGDHYSPAPRPAPRTWNRRDSPPTGPRHSIPRAPSNSQKRQREDDYTPPIHPQKRFKDDGRDAVRPRAASPPRSWPVRDAENERPASNFDWVPRIGTCISLAEAKATVHSRKNIRTQMNGLASRKAYFRALVILPVILPGELRAVGGELEGGRITGHEVAAVAASDPWPTVWSEWCVGRQLPEPHAHVASITLNC